METCCKSFLAVRCQNCVGDASEQPHTTGDIMTTSLCLIDAVSPGSGPLRPSSQKPQQPRHTWAAAGPPLATLSRPGLLWDLRLQCWMSTYIYVHTAVEKGCIDISRQSLLDANISSGSQCNPKPYANPLPLWKEHN